VQAGRVAINGRIVRDPESPVRPAIDRVSVDGREVSATDRVVVALNKPRGLVTTTRDEQGRATVYDCFAGADLPWLAPVGRLDQASEGLLLFTNDPGWAARITGPGGPSKTYHVQVDRIPDGALVERIAAGATVDGESLGAAAARLLRTGTRQAWLEIVLTEGRNRQLRRLLGAFDLQVLRLVRVAIGDLPLGTLAKGQWRQLDAAEIAGLAS
jgi:23S rRNA pseudouridine2605 synthase